MKDLLEPQRLIDHFLDFVRLPPLALTLFEIALDFVRFANIAHFESTKRTHCRMTVDGCLESQRHTSGLDGIDSRSFGAQLVQTHRELRKAVVFLVVRGHRG